MSKTVQIQVDADSLDKGKRRFMATATPPGMDPIAMHSNELRLPLTEQEWRTYARLTARIMAQECPTTDHATIKAKMDGHSLVVDPKAVTP